MQRCKKPLISALVDKITNPEIIEVVEEKFNVKLDKNLPILMKSKNKYHNIELPIGHVTLKDLMKLEFILFFVFPKAISGKAL